MVIVVIKKQKVFRPAVAMIELIFALVIMGIVLMSAPQLVNQAQSSGYVSTQQEAIAVASSHMAFVLSRPWDEGNTNQGDVTILSTDSDALVPPNGLQNVAGRRRGTPALGALHRVYIDSINSPIVNASLPNTFGSGRDLDAGGTAENVNDDIDDFDNTVADLTFQNFIAGQDDYIDSRMVMNTSVNYMVDSPNNIATYNTNRDTLTFPLDRDGDGLVDVFPARSSHIKYVRVVLTNDPNANTPDDLNKTIVLEAFSCNIGEYHLEQSDPL